MKIAQIHHYCIHNADEANVVSSEFQNWCSRNVYYLVHVNGPRSWNNSWDTALRSAYNFTGSVSSDIANLPENGIIVQVTDPTCILGATTKAVTHLLNVKQIKIGEETYYTQLSEKFINLMSDIVDLSDIAPKGATIGCRSEAFKTRTSPNAQQAVQLLADVRCSIDDYGTIAILPSSIIPAVKEKHKQLKEINVLKVGALYKGAGTFFSLATVPFDYILSGGRFFLYSQDINILDGHADNYRSVKFIGLGIFGAEKKLTKYSNSLNLLQKLKDLTDDYKADLLFNSELYLHKNPALTHITQYQPGIRNKLKLPPNKTAKLSFVDSNCVHSVDRQQLAPFAVKTSLLSKPETLEYNTAKKKFDSGQAMLKQIENNVQLQRTHANDAEWNKQRNQETIEQLKKQIAELEQRKAEAEKAIIAAEEAKTTFLTKFAPVREELTVATTKYQEVVNACLQNEVDLTSLERWQQHGYRITNLVVKSKRLKIAMQPKQIAELLITNPDDLYIAEFEITTTRPSIVHKNPHIVGFEKAEKHATGPFKINLTFEATNYAAVMTLKLLDDRSIRAMWPEGGSVCVKVHPHSTPDYLDKVSFDKDPLQAWQNVTNKAYNVCLGELEPILTKAMGKLSLQEIFYGIHNWLQTANTADAYGASLSKFPRLEDVILQDFGPPVEITTSAKPMYDFEEQYMKFVNDALFITAFLKAGDKLIIVNMSHSDGKTVIINKNEMFFLNSSALQNSINELSSALVQEGYQYINANKKDVSELTTTWDVPELKKKYEDAISVTKPSDADDRARAALAAVLTLEAQQEIANLPADQIAAPTAPIVEATTTAPVVEEYRPYRRHDTVSWNELQQQAEAV